MIVENKIIGHRGASLYAPENTRASLKFAASLSAEWIESDVRLTKDGKLVMFHDASLDRTTDGSGLVSLTNFEDICKLDCGAWFSEKYRGEKILSFSDFLELVIHYKFKLALELKYMAGQEIDVVNKVIEHLKPFKSSLSNGFFIISFSERILRLISKKLQSVPTCLAFSPCPINADEIANEIGADIVHIGNEFIDDSALDRIKNLKTECHVATVNDKNRARYLLQNGVASILSDDPVLFDNK